MGIPIHILFLHELIANEILHKHGNTFLFNKRFTRANVEPCWFQGQRINKRNKI